MSLPEAAYRHLLALLPPGRRPTPGGTADGVVRMLGGLEARLMEELFALAREAFPHLAEALDRHAQARMMWRIPPEEGDTSFRARVVGAVEFWRWAGTRKGLERALARLGFPVDVVEGPFRNAFDGAWSFDYENAFTDPAWAEFLLRLWPAGAFRKKDGEFLRHLVRELKPAHAVLRGIELRTQDGRLLRLLALPQEVLWDLGTWGDFYFGDLRPMRAEVSQPLRWLAQGRVLQGGTFGGWEFGDRSF